MKATCECSSSLRLWHLYPECWQCCGSPRCQRLTAEWLVNIWQHQLGDKEGKKGRENRTESTYGGLDNGSHSVWLKGKWYGGLIFPEDASKQQVYTNTHWVGPTTHCIFTQQLFATSELIRFSQGKDLRKRRKMWLSNCVETGQPGQTQLLSVIILCVSLHPCE